MAQVHLRSLNLVQILERDNLLDNKKIVHDSPLSSFEGNSHCYCIEPKVLENYPCNAEFYLSITIIRRDSACQLKMIGTKELNLRNILTI